MVRDSRAVRTSAEEFSIVSTIGSAFFVTRGFALVICGENGSEIAVVEAKNSGLVVNPIHRDDGGITRWSVGSGPSARDGISVTTRRKTRSVSRKQTLNKRKSSFLYCFSGCGKEGKIYGRPQKRARAHFIRTLHVNECA